MEAVYGIGPLFNLEIISPTKFSFVKNNIQNTESDTMPTGKIKWFDPDKGFGFIQPDEGSQDLFVHHTETGGQVLNDGDPVEFEIGEGRKGPCATQVKKL